MTQEEKRVWLIQYLLHEKPEYSSYPIPAGDQEQKNLLRALMNVRMPDPIDEEFLRVQDEYLREETRRRGIVDLSELVPCPQDGRICLWQGDMTRLRVDAVVNPGNDQLLGCFQPLHNCLDNILHSASGIQLRLRCNELMKAQGHPEPTGRAKITPAYNLPCSYVIHTVGPIVCGRLTREHEAQLASCYRSCLQIAEKNGVRSIAFCCISTGVFMFPPERAAEIAVTTVREFLKTHTKIEKVIFNVYKDTDREIYEKLLNTLS
ncbi:MAG: protein-ADP-ribose hydrolase [Clostridia bacterium]|nr:protein-ADP-ribose hydrolase [Clostridia bacterium]